MTYNEELPLKSMTLWTRCLVTSRDKLKTYLHYRSACDHHSWQDVNLSSGTPAHKVTWPFDHVVMEK